MKKWKIWLAFALIFFSGISVGAVGTGLVIRNKFVSVAKEGSPAVAKLINAALTRKLDLTPEQQEIAAQTIAETQQQLFLLRRQYFPQAKQIIDEGANKLRGSLSPEQQEKLNALREKTMQRFARFAAP